MAKKTETTKAPTTRKVAKKPAKKRAAKSRVLGFVAVSATAATRIKSFGVMAGFDELGPRADLNRVLEGAGDWKGYAVVATGKKLAFRAVKPKA